jgi:hypothetical protein
MNMFRPIISALLLLAVHSLAVADVKQVQIGIDGAT